MNTIKIRKMSKICRICLVLVENEANSISINTVEESTGFMPLRDKLALCVPEMVLDMIQDPVICTTCSRDLQAAYEFKNKCLQTEEKIRRLIQCVGGVVYSLDLSKIANANTRIDTRTDTRTPKQSSGVQQYPPAVITKVKTEKTVVKPVEVAKVIVKKEPDPVCEIEFQDVSKLTQEKPEEVSVPIDVPVSNDPLVPVVVSRRGRRPHMKKGAQDASSLAAMAGPNDFRDIQCNFCNTTFPGLFYLRKHQKACTEAISNAMERIDHANASKQQLIQIPGLKRRRRTQNNAAVSQVVKIELPEDKAIQTRNVTRTTLPAKAKNILQKWLFQHRENPYPSDAEKLHLIKLTNLTLVQVENWFINARRRILQRMLTKSHKFKSKLMKFEVTESSSDEEHTSYIE